jgi:hypothetical protein
MSSDSSLNDLQEKINEEVTLPRCKIYLKLSILICLIFLLLHLKQ